MDKVLNKGNILLIRHTNRENRETPRNLEI
jgi:hypothetical protein